MKLRFVILIFLAFALACNKTNNKNIKYGYHFFPVTEGHYVIYDVLDVFHDSALTIPHDTSVYQIKEVIGEAFEDDEGDTAMKLYRYFRANDTMSWSIQDVWSVKRSKKNAEVVDENDRRVVMAFAISYDQDWDCNSLNNDGELHCYYKNIYKPLSVGGTLYDSTVTVEHEDLTSYIQFLRSYSVFAPNIGCIYRVDKDLEINNFDTLNIHYGTEIIYTATEYGVE